MMRRNGARSKAGTHWLVVGTVCVGAFMAALDASIMNIALPSLRSNFHSHMANIEWVSLVYILTLAGLIVPFSRLSDMYGRRRMYTAGFTVFILGSFLCGVSPSLAPLLAARVLQGAGAAMLQANSISIITRATPAGDRGKAIGIQASAQGVGLSLGPAIGGALLSYLGWRWIFFINVPVGILGTVLGVILLPTDPDRTERETFDLAGAISFVLMLTAFVYILNKGLHAGMASPSILVADAVLGVGLVVFSVVETRRKCPLLDLSLFKDSKFLWGNMTVMLSFVVMYSVMFLTPFYLDGVQHMRPFTTGLYMTLIPIGMTVLTPVAGMMSDAVGGRLPTVIGGFTSFLGCVVLAVLSWDFHIALLVAGLLLCGSGMGLFTPPNNSQVMECAPPNRVGVAGGVLNTARTIGMGLGVTVGGLAYQLLLRFLHVLVENRATPTEMVWAFKNSYVVMAGFSLLTLIVVVISHRRENTRPSQLKAGRGAYTGRL